MYIGANRFWSKKIALVFIIIGFLFASPPGLPPPDDFLNVGLAGVMNTFLGIDFMLALVLTYTVIGWGLIYVGALIYPYSTIKFLNGRKNQMLGMIRKTFTNPIWFGMFVISVVFLIFVINAYTNYITVVLGVS